MPSAAHEIASDFVSCARPPLLALYAGAGPLPKKLNMAFEAILAAVANVVEVGPQRCMPSCALHVFRQINVDCALRLTATDLNLNFTGVQAGELRREGGDVGQRPIA